MLSHLIEANLRRFSGGIFLDMQSVNDLEILDMNHWAHTNFTLVPYGTLYYLSSLKRLNLSAIESFHLTSWDKIAQLRQMFVREFDSSHRLYEKQVTLVNQIFPIGSWESAVYNIYNDAHNQYGLSLLTYVIAIAGQKDLRLESMPILFDRLIIAIDILGHSHRNVQLYGTISSAADDLFKNYALAYLRYQAFLMVVDNVKDTFLKVVLHQIYKEKVTLLSHL
jgi:hypothetical protein